MERRARQGCGGANDLPKLPSRRSATCPVPQIRVLPVVSLAEAAAGVPSRVTYTSSCGPLIHKPLVPFTPTLEKLYIPSPEKIAAAIREVHSYAG